MSEKIASRTQAEIDDLRNRCAALADAGGEGAVEAQAISNAFGWLFGDTDDDPLDGFPEPAGD